MYCGISSKAVSLHRTINKTDVASHRHVTQRQGISSLTKNPKRKFWKVSSLNKRSVNGKYFLHPLGKKMNPRQRPCTHWGALSQFWHPVLVPSSASQAGFASRQQTWPTHRKEKQIFLPLPRAGTGLRGAAETRCPTATLPARLRPGNTSSLFPAIWPRMLMQNCSFLRRLRPTATPRSERRQPGSCSLGSQLSGSTRSQGGSSPGAARLSPPPASRPLRPAASGPRRPAGRARGRRGGRRGAARPDGCGDRAVPGGGCVPTAAGRGGVLCGGATWGETDSLQRRGRRQQQLLTGRVYRRRRCHLVSEKN